MRRSVPTDEHSGISPEAHGFSRGGKRVWSVPHPIDERGADSPPQSEL